MCVCMCAYVCLCVCMCVCVLVCMCVCVYVCTYMYVLVDVHLREFAGLKRVMFKGMLCSQTSSCQLPIHVYINCVLCNVLSTCLH